MQQVFQWINEPATWSEEDGSLSVVTDEETDFWRETWYGFERFSGHIYATDCKKGLPARGTGFLRAVCEAADIPVYGIGGIHLDEAQIKEVLGCGAAGGCIMSGMMRV